MQILAQRCRAPPASTLLLLRDLGTLLLLRGGGIDDLAASLQAAATLLDVLAEAACWRALSTATRALARCCCS